MRVDNKFVDIQQYRSVWKLPNQLPKPLDVLALGFISFFILCAPAQAYFDLGLGTYMLQLIFGFGAAYLLCFKNSILKKFRPKKKDLSPPPQVNENDKESPKDSKTDL